MKRAAMLAAAAARAASGAPWDLVVIGGGATGVGVALDAASRGLQVALFERQDFGSATSSRSTKLIHGGVRYLQQGNFALVREALRERALLLHNAPHLVHDLRFLVPTYAWWEGPWYATGLKLYDWLAGGQGTARSQRLSPQAALRQLPGLRAPGLRGAIAYDDAQFDDARLLIALAATAAAQGAVLVNYAPVVEIVRDERGAVTGVVAVDQESGQRLQARARVVVNATGIFTDETRRLVDANSPALLQPSQGIHLVLDRSFLPGDAALLVPHTRDGRVLFAIPWLGHTLVGTTDTPVAGPSYHPQARGVEVDFILETAARYLSRPPRRADVLSVFAGIRPLVRAGWSRTTARRSREHVLHRDRSGLLTITGGKWTTYRRMAEDTVDEAERLAGLPHAPCMTGSLPIHGGGQDGVHSGNEPTPLHPALPVTADQVVWAVREEMARTLEDVLARRTRALFLDARAAMMMAPVVARLMAAELHQDEAWLTAQLAAFGQLGREFLLETQEDSR